MPGASRKLGVRKGVFNCNDGGVISRLETRKVDTACLKCDDIFKGLQYKEDGVWRRKQRVCSSCAIENKIQSVGTYDHGRFRVETSRTRPRSTGQ